jgi:hypothetical protein
MRPRTLVAESSGRASPTERLQAQTRANAAGKARHHATASRMDISFMVMIGIIFLLLILVDVNAMLQHWVEVAINTEVESVPRQPFHLFAPSEGANHGNFFGLELGRGVAEPAVHESELAKEANRLLD